jgi:hypothetical protein
MDELSKELHGQVAEPIPAEPGRTAEEGYEYTRNGTADVFLPLCPLSGWRHLEVTSKRGYLQFAAVMKALVDVHFPKAEKVRVVLDNLNTHVFGALYEAFPPEGARRIATRLELHYTPEHGSWLNMAEMEFSVLARQCLNRRIETAQELAEAIAAWERARNAARTKIEWSFRVADARKKLHWIYPS